MKPERRRLCFLMVVIVFVLMLATASADTVTQNGVEVTLTTDKLAYAANEDIPVTLTVTNKSGLPLSQLVLQHIALEGYTWTSDSEAYKYQGLLNHGESLSITAINTLYTGIPSTGDSTPIGLWMTMLFASVIGLAFLGTHKRGARRFLCLLLCFVCAGAFMPQLETAKADSPAFSLNHKDWPSKPKIVSRSTSRTAPVTVEAAEAVLVDNQELEAKASVTFSFPGSSDNLQDGTIDLGDLETMESQGRIDVTYDQQGEVSFIDGSFTDEKVLSKNDAADVLNTAASLFGDGFHADADDMTEQQMTDIDGRTENYYRYSPTVNGVPVLGSQIVLAADKDGTVRSLTSSFDDIVLDVDTTPTITKEEAIEAAKTKLRTDETIRDYVDQLEYQVELLVYAAEAQLPVGLVYAVTARTPADSTKTSTPIFDETIYLYANGTNKKLIHSSHSNIKTWQPTRIEATDLKGNRRFINCLEQNRIYRLWDMNNNIITWIADFDEDNKPVYMGKYADSYIDVFGNQKIDGDIVSAHANMSKVVEYYKNVLNRDSFDNKGKRVNVSTRFDDVKGNPAYDNANWWPDAQLFSFGEGKDFVAALDTVGHEFTHAVNGYVIGDGHSGLIYKGESGALEEAYCDIMGGLIENKNGPDRWNHSEDSGAASRDMSNPSRLRYYRIYLYPEHYSDWRFRNQLDSKHDNGGVHVNNTIYTFATYKMMTDNRTKDISQDTWAQVFYDSLHRFVSNSNFLHGRSAVICSAKKYGFTTDQQQAIKDAFDAVGIVEPAAVRFVLRWGEEPHDLDSHLVGPGAKNASERFHVYYGQKTYFNNGKYEDDFDEEFETRDRLYAADLDYDDVTSYGPEITTIHTLTPGTYYFFVHDFTNQEIVGSTAMARSNATVEVYARDGLYHRFAINPNSSGTYWDVCKITIASNGSITVVGLNTYGDATTCR